MSKRFVFDMKIFVPYQTDKKTNKKRDKNQNNCAEPSNYIKITIIIITLAVSVSIRRIGINSMNILLHYLIYIHKYPQCFCIAVLLLFYPPTCVSTLENKMRFSFLFHWNIQQTPNTSLVTHIHTGLRHPWPHVPIWTHTHSHTHTRAPQFVDTVHLFTRARADHNASVPRLKGNISNRAGPSVSRHSDLSVLNAEAKFGSSGYIGAFTWLSCLKQHSRLRTSTDMLFWRL